MKTRFKDKVSVPPDLYKRIIVALLGLNLIVALYYVFRAQETPVANSHVPTPVTRNVLVFNAWHDYQLQTFRGGGSISESMMFNGLLEALRNIPGVKIYFTSFEKEAIDYLRMKAFDMIYIEKMGAPHLKTYIEGDKNKFRMLDFWGTPYEQTKDFHNLNIKQYWTPYNNLYNSFLGFAIRGPPTNLFPTWKLDGSKRPPGKYKFLLWGKLPKYFSEKHYELIDKIMKKYNLEAVATIHDEKKQVPSIITNLGIVEHGVWEKTLAESVFVMGFGDPIMGPTPLEGIAAGCAYLNPLFPETKTLGMNRKMPLDSQHPQVRDIYGGEPYVYDIILENHDHVLATIGRVLENLDKGLIKPYLPYDYTIEAITAKVANDLATRPEMSNDKFIFIP